MPKGLQGLAAEFESEEALVRAIHRMRELGYRQMDGHTPYPSDEVIEALELPKSRVPFMVLAGALLGMLVGYGIPYLTNVVDFPLNVGGRPDNAVPAFIPLMFETAVLFGGTFGFFGYLISCGLPRLWHPLMEVRGFERVTTDRFWLSVASEDDRYDLDRTQEELADLEPLRVERFGGWS